MLQRRIIKILPLLSVLSVFSLDRRGISESTSLSL